MATFDIETFDEWPDWGDCHDCGKPLEPDHTTGAPRWGKHALCDVCHNHRTKALARWLVDALEHDPNLQRVKETK